MDEKVADFNRAVRDGTLVTIVEVNWCNGENIITTDTSSYCASNSDLSEPCSSEFNTCRNLVDGCCTSGNKCGLGE